MKSFPSIPRLGDESVSEILDAGNLWVYEKVDGANFRFGVHESTPVLTFGSRGRTFSDEKDAPHAYAHTIRYIQNSIDYKKIDSIVNDDKQYVWFGESMHYHTIEYDWERTPSFLGFAVWDVNEQVFVHPRRAKSMFDCLNLPFVPVLESGIPAEAYAVSVPDSMYRDGIAEGVVIENTTKNQSAKYRSENFREVDETVPLETSDMGLLAEKFVTPHRIEKCAAKMQNSGEVVSVDVLFEYVFEDVVREEYKVLYHSDPPVRLSAFRKAVSERVRRFVETRGL